MKKPKNKNKTVTTQLIEAWLANTDRYHWDKKLSEPVFAVARKLLAKRRKERLDSPPAFHTDLAAAFRDGQEFVSDRGRTLKVAVKEVGKLVVTSGRIVVCDPTYAPVKHPLARTIPKGKYAVELCSADGRIACAKLRIRNTKPVRWELAIWPGQKLADLESDLFYGYGVDAGTGCFLDFDQDKFRESFRDESLFDYDARTPSDPFKGEWAERVLDPKSGGNIIVFSSGWGDGSYASFWGFDASDNVVCLVTDFGVLLDFPEITFRINGAFVRPFGEVRHRALDLADLILEIAPGTVAGRSILLGCYGPKANSVTATLFATDGGRIETEESTINMSGSNGMRYSCQEFIVPKKTKVDGIGLQLNIPLETCSMQPV